MSQPRAETEVVLRNTLLQPEAVRIGRRHARPPVAGTAAAPAALVVPAPAGDHDALVEAALAQAREGGLRLGREEGLRTGHEEGLKKGQAEGQAAGRAALEKAVAEATAPLRERERQLAKLLTSLGEQEAAWRAAAEDEAVALAYELACRVLGAALSTPEGVRAQAQQLLAAARPRAAAFHVHPGDLGSLQQDDSPDSAPRWVADAAVRSGGCIVKGPSGALDARLETVLEQCLQGLLEARARRAGATA